MQELSCGDEHGRMHPGVGLFAQDRLVTGPDEARGSDRQCPGKRERLAAIGGENWLATNRQLPRLLHAPQPESGRATILMDPPVSRLSGTGPDRGI